MVNNLLLEIDYTNIEISINNIWMYISSLLHEIDCWIFSWIFNIWGTLSPILASQSVNIFPPESKPYGLTFAEHQRTFGNGY